MTVAFQAVTRETLRSVAGNEAVLARLAVHAEPSDGTWHAGLVAAAFEIAPDA